MSRVTLRASLTSLTQMTLVTVNQRQRAPDFVATQVAICCLLNGLVDFAHFRQAYRYGQVVSTCQKSAPSDKQWSSERIYLFLSKQIRFHGNERLKPDSGPIPDLCTKFGARRSINHRGVVEQTYRRQTPIIV